MTGENFYQFLMNQYILKGEYLHGNRQFIRWLPKTNGTSNFQFKFLGNTKSVPKKWFVDAKDAMNGGQEINRNWFNNHFGQSNSNDCRASVALWLLNRHQF